MRYTEVKLTPAQERQWSETMTALVWHCPAFNHIFYTMLDTVNSKRVAMFSRDIPIAATDGSSLILNPDTFFQFNLLERLFIVTHEILHCVMDHCRQMFQFHTRGKIAFPDGTTLPYDQETMNAAADYVINALLMESNIGAMPQKDGQQVGLFDKNIATGNDSAIETYRKIFKQQKGKGPGGNCPKGFDEHLKPGTSQGKDPTQASQERNDTEWATQIQAAANAARAQGKLPAGLERLFGSILNPQVDWKEKIQALFARKLGCGSYDWRRPDRRLIVRDIYSPGRSGYGAGTVVVGADTSGSIGPEELDMFFAEIAGILEDVKPKRLLIMWADAKVHRVDECEEPGDLNTIRYKGAPGGGGTSFVPVFEEIENLGVIPDALVYLTDGMGTFPAHSPKYPVIWGNIYPQSQYPFGDVVDIPKQAKRDA